MARKAQKKITYDTIVRGTNDYIPVQFTRKLSDGTTSPYDLTGKLLVLTVKKKEYDDDLQDATAEKSLIDNYNFKITIDCDDSTNGLSGPSDSSTVWKDNYQGMYGQDPTSGKAIFRLTKKMTLIDPGEYNFDIRMLEKEKSVIGQVTECRDWMPIFGSFEIQGTPGNRVASNDWNESV
jgi:hypothetical protein